MTRPPTFDAVGGIADVTVGSYGRADARATLNLPLARDLALRVSGLTRYQPGLGRNLTDGARVNGHDVQGGRAALLWKPDERLMLFATADLTLEDSTPRYPQQFVADPALPGRFTNVFARPEGAIDRFRSADTDPLNATRTGGGSLRLDFRPGGVAVSAITGYSRLHSEIGFDQTAGAPGAGANVILLQDQRQHSFSQEVQLSGALFGGRVELIGGAFYFDEHNDQLTAVSFATPTGTTVARFRNGDFFNAPSHGAGTSGNWSPYRPALDTDSYSAFASATGQLGSKARLTAGLRITAERKRYDVQFLTALDTVLVLPDGRRAERRIAQR